MGNELEAGPELDAAVAVAVGYRVESWEMTRGHMRGTFRVYVPGDAPPKSEWREGSPYWHRVKVADDWKPSIDTNAALEWGAKVGLFCSSKWNASLSQGFGTGWEVWCVRHELDPMERNLSSAPTPAHAVSLAIIALPSLRNLIASVTSN